MATAQQVFNQLVADSTIIILTGSHRAHDNLRIRLVKFYTNHKKLMETIGYSGGSDHLGLCGSYHADTGYSTFTIKVPRKNQQIDYKIVKVNSV